MNIEIKGIGFGNRGAELMLIAILNRLRGSFPQARFGAATYAGTFARRTQYGLDHVVPDRWSIATLRHRMRRKEGRLICESDMDVLLDSSGYAYGDAWKTEWIQNSAAHISRYRRRNRKIILLPQAFGPFANPSVRTAAETIIRSASLVYARDPESLEYVRALAPGAGHVRLAPDFTGPLPGRLPEDAAADERRVCIVPNAEMLRICPDAYVPFMTRCIRSVADRGYAPCILLHEGERDRELAARLCETSELPILDDADPQRLKGIIGSCAFIIGSRYHGLVSAFSQGVPAMGTSWSHKYRHLFDDYGCPEMLIDLQSSDCFPDQLLNSLCDLESRMALRGRLLEKSRAVNTKTEAMWREIETVLHS